MITNLPSSEEFERLAKNCLVQAFNIVYETDKVIFDLGEQVLQADVWRYSQGKLNTAVVLIHQAIESFMKASVCRTSPYLLLEGRRKDWPVLPDQADKDFNEFYTTPAESLLRTYAATAPVTLNREIIEHIESMRTLRNQIVHGISRTQLAPKKLVENVLDTFLFFAGKDVWWESVFSEHLLNPLSEFYGFGHELAKLPERLDYAEAVLSRAKFTKHFTRNIKARRYLCPVCKGQWDEQIEDEEYPYYWAFLNPPTAEGVTVTCLSCESESWVEREDCYYTDCKGSVIFYGDENDAIICLTCGEVQFTGTEAEDDAKREAEREIAAEESRKRIEAMMNPPEEEKKPKRKSTKKTQQ